MIINELLSRFVSVGRQNGLICFSGARARYSQTAVSKNKNLKKVLTEAESTVGYPTSFLNLRWLLNDEAANIALHIRKLIGSNHPLPKIARNLLMGNGGCSWGLIVLLVSKAAGVYSSFKDIEHDHAIGILHSQRVLAEVAEMMRTSHILHNGVISIRQETPNLPEMNFGNTVALLCGDYLLSTSFRELALLRNSYLNELMSSALKDLSEANFVGTLDNKNRPLPSRPVLDPEKLTVPNAFTTTTPFEVKGVLGNSKAEWTLRTLLGGASLLARSCQGTLMLAGHPNEFQEIGYILGRNVGLAWQAAFEYEQFQKEDTQRFSLVSAPVLFHLEYDPSFYSEFENLVNGDIIVDYSKIKKTVLDGPGLERTYDLKEEFVSLALDALDNFSDSEAKKALINLLKSLC